VNGGAYQPLTQLGADTTSYTDTNIPYNSAGDAEVQYEVVAVGQPDSSPPDPPANTGDGPTTAPTSAPAISGGVGAEEVEVDHVTWKMGAHAAATTAPTAWTSVYGYSFGNYLAVAGKNLQDVQFTQYVNQSAKYTPYSGIPASVTLIDDNGFWVDGKGKPGKRKPIPLAYQNLECSPDGTAGFTWDDGHAINPTLPINNVLGGGLYTYLAKNSSAFVDDFTVVDPKALGPANHKVIYTYSWGYSWTNYPYQYAPARQDGFPNNVSKCAYLEDPAAVGKLQLVGYGDGVDFSSVSKNGN
jgi:hypothetical protein